LLLLRTSFASGHNVVLVAVLLHSEPPTWTVNTLVPTLGVFVNDTRELHVNCIGRGNPAPVIHWTKDGEMLDATWYTVQSEHQSVDTYSTVVNSILSWRGTISVSHN